MCNYAYNVVLFNKWANSQMSQNVSVSIDYYYGFGILCFMKTKQHYQMIFHRWNIFSMNM